MADGVTIRIRRKDEFIKKLGDLAPALFEAVKQSNHQTADEMVETAQNFVPVRTGRLRASIVATGPGDTPPSYSQGGGGKAVPDGSYAVSAGNSQVRYAHMVEYGTAPHINAGWAAGTKNPGTHRRPFFWPAYRLVRARMKARFTRLVRKAIQQAAIS